MNRADGENNTHKKKKKSFDFCFKICCLFNHLPCSYVVAPFNLLVSATVSYSFKGFVVASFEGFYWEPFRTSLKLP